MKTFPLHLYQEITLLTLRDEKETVSISNLSHILAGSILAKLILESRIRISKNKKRMVTLLDTSPSGDPLIDECISKIGAAKRNPRLQTWVGRLASIERLRHKAAESLCQLGALKKMEDKILIIFNRTRYPEVNPAPEKELVKRLRQAIFNTPAQLESRDILLLSLANAANLLPQFFDRKKLKAQEKNIKRIAEGELASEATIEVINAINLSIIVAAVVVPAVVSSG